MNRFPVKIVVTNAGTGTARNVVVRDTLPAGLVTQDGKSSIVSNVGTLGAGQSRTINATLKATASGQHVNKASATADGGLTADASTTTMVREPKLTIEKTGPNRLYMGRKATYQIVVKNVGDGDARNTTVEDMIPAGTTVVSATGGATRAGTKVMWQLGTLKPNESKNLSLTVNAPAAGTLTNKATAKAFCASAVSATASTVVAGIPAILLEVIDIEDPIEVGGNETYLITVTNQGSAPDTNIRIECTLEDTMQYVSSSGVTRGSSEGAAVTFAPLPSLAPKAKAIWKVVLKAVDAGDVRFKVTMNSDQLKRPVEETEATNFYR